jgi:hypothetical protein
MTFGKIAHAGCVTDYTKITYEIKVMTRHILE